MTIPKDGPIRIEPGFSKWLALYLLFVHTSALVVIVLLPFPLLLDIALVLLVAISFCYYWRRDLLRLSAHSVIRVEWGEENGWRLWLGDDSMQNATLIPSSFLHRYLLALDLKTEDSGRYRLLLPQDSLQTGLHRRLRMVLKLENHFGE